MSENSGEENQNCFVKAISDYTYPYKGEEVSIIKDEIFLLIRKTTDDWWQVIRSGDKRIFYAPSKYLQVTTGHFESRKSSLKKKLAHQRQLQAQQRLHLEKLSRIRQVPSSSVSDVIKEVPEKTQNDNSQVKILNKEGEMCSISCQKELYLKALPDDSKTDFDQRTIFKPYDNGVDESVSEVGFIAPPVAFLDKTRNKLPTSVSSSTELPSLAGTREDLEDKHACSSLSDSSTAFDESHESSPNKSVDSYCGSVDPSSDMTHIESLDSFSTDTSRSSLDGHNTDLFAISEQTTVAKSASFDVLLSQESTDALGIPRPRAASSEELDSSGVGLRKYQHMNEPINLRNRSNSVELRRFDNRFDLSDPSTKTTSLDKGRKCRLARDPMNRRRSWALNEHFSPWIPSSTFPKDKFKEYQDIPPKLPPKMRKNQLSSVISASSDDLRHLGNDFVASKLSSPTANLPQNEKPNRNSSFKSNSLQSKDEHWNGQMKSDTERTEKEICTQLINQTLYSTEKSDLSEEGKTATNDDHKNQEVTNSVVSEDHKKEVFKREASVCQLIERMEIKAKSSDVAPTTQSVKLPLELPSPPTEAPRRILFDGWGEFLDPASGRPFYFNQLSMERRWKPPRKNLTSFTASQTSLQSREVSGIGLNQSTITMSTSLSIEKNVSTSATPSTLLSDSAIPLPTSSSTLHCKIPDSSLQLHSTNFPADGTCVDQPSPVSPSHTSASKEHKPQKSPPTSKSSKSFFSSISSSFSFMKNSSSNSQTSPTHQSGPSALGISAPQTNSKFFPLQTSKSVHNISYRPPPTGYSESSPTTKHKAPSGKTKSLEREVELKSLHKALLGFKVPPGWIRKYDALSHQVFFQSLVTGEKWNPAIDKSGTVYVYSSTGVESRWNLPEYENLSSPVTPLTPPLSPLEEDQLGEPAFKGIVVWRYLIRDGKKAKKSWSTAVARYYPPPSQTNLPEPSLPNKSSVGGGVVVLPTAGQSPSLARRTFGVLVFAKKHNESKMDRFDLTPPCFLDLTSTSKKVNSFGLRNGLGSHIQLQVESPAMTAHWTKVLVQHDKVDVRDLCPPKMKRQNNKGSEKDSPAEEVDSTKGIKDTLMMFFKRRIQQETLAKKGIYKDTVFGSTIGEICLKEQLKTPLFVLRVIRCIEKDRSNFRVDGLYRISGNASRIQKIRIEVGQNRYNILEEEKDVHNLTGALKLFFRELKEPVIPFDDYSSFILATDHHRHKNRSTALRSAVRKLPSCNRETLRILLEHLLKVNEFERENRMSVLNLAIVFGPCLLWPRTASAALDLMTDAMLHNRVVEALLSDFQYVFSTK